MRTPKDSENVDTAVAHILTNLRSGPPSSRIDGPLWQAALLQMIRHVNHLALKKYNVVTLVDFRKSISEKRLWVIDLNARVVLLHVHVAHGSGSGGRDGIPTMFQDVSESYKSNLGSYITLYRKTSGAGQLEKMGLSKWGTALVIDGLDITNQKTQARAIIFHGASYMNPYSSSPQYGRSQGCFATHPNDNQKIIELIQGGSFVYSYVGTSQKPE